MKTLYFYNPSRMLTSFREFDDAYEAAMSTDVAPSAKALDTFSSYGPGTVLFDEQRQRWGVVKKTLLSRIGDKVENELRETAGRSSMLMGAMLRPMVEGLAGIGEFPTSVEYMGEVVVFDTFSDLKDGYVRQRLLGRLVDAASNLIFNGGTVAGITIKPLSEQTVAELQNFSPAEAVLQVMDLLEEEHSQGGTSN